MNYFRSFWRRENADPKLFPAKKQHDKVENSNRNLRKMTFDKVRSLYPETLTLEQLQSLNLSQEELLSLLLETSSIIDSLESSEESRQREILSMLQGVSSIIDERKLNVQLEVSADCLGAISDNINLLVSEFNESLSQLPTTHHLYQKYKLSKDVFIVEDIKFEFAYIHGGTFMMGSQQHPSETPIHKVKIKNFYLGKYPITQSQYQTIMGENPSHFKGEDLPVDSVSWNDAYDFCQKLTKKIGKHVCLPSESQWEYASRSLDNYRYSGSNHLEDVGWFTGNSDHITHSVYSKKPNANGVFGMSGNVWEWCQDTWHSNYDVAPCDGSAREDREHVDRVLRGGCWNSEANHCLVTSRHRHNSYNKFSNCGFRIALVADNSKL